MRTVLLALILATGCAALGCDSKKKKPNDPPPPPQDSGMEKGPKEVMKVSVNSFMGRRVSGDER